MQVKKIKEILLVCFAMNRPFKIDYYGLNIHIFTYSH